MESNEQNKQIKQKQIHNAKNRLTAVREKGCWETGEIGEGIKEKKNTHKKKQQKLRQTIV